MIDLRDLRERPEKYREACEKKHIAFDLDKFLELDARYRALRSSVESLRAQQNAFNKELPKLQGADKSAKLEEMRKIAAQLKDDSQTLKDTEEKWKSDQLFIPSIPLDKVPVGKDESENVEIRRVGEVPRVGFRLRDHVELGEILGIIEIERGVKVSGSRSYYLKGDGARLQHAVLQFAMDFISSKGFLLMDPPHIVKWEAMMGTSYFPGGEESAYHLDDRDKDYYLIGTSEVSVCAYHTDEILEADQLPKRYAGFSPCYRREAGTYGKDTRGIYRIHQFYKVEQVIVCRADPEESARMHAEILGNSEELVQMLGLPYRVVDVCSGDMGRGQVYKNDVEVWMPSRGAYGETHSCSTMHDFQARRLGLRYRGADGKTVYCHTLNNTLVASPRILIPLLEINQQEDGSVVIPPVLRPYMRGQEMIRPR